MAYTAPVDASSDLHRRPRSLVLILLLLALLAGVLGAVGGAPTPARAAGGPVTGAAVAALATPAHPYSDPVWFPLRKPANIGCAKTACGAYEAHGYWSIDWTGQKGDPVYAAGAGILHIGGRAAGCAPKGVVESQGGNWVWIDHGAGVVSRYHHLDKIVGREGQLVTPATVIGTMGSSGDSAPCTINYLHFEVRHGGVKGTRVDFGQLFACTQAGLRRFPAEFGVTSWDDPAIHTRPRVRTPQLSSNCLQALWLRTPGRAAIAATGTSRTAVVTWKRPAGDIRSVVIGLEIYRPSLHRYASLGYRAVAPGAGSYRWTGLQNGRRYRVTASYRNVHGHGRTSAARTTVPAAAPGAPRSPRYVVWTKRDYVHYGWYRPARNGSDVTSFTVAARCGSHGTGYSAWRLYRLPVKDAYFNVRGMKAKGYTSCEVKVRATNGAGTGAWSKTSKIRWHG